MKRIALSNLSPKLQKRITAELFARTLDRALKANKVIHDAVTFASGGHWINLGTLKEVENDNHGLFSTDMKTEILESTVEIDAWRKLGLNKLFTDAPNVQIVYARSEAFLGVPLSELHKKLVDNYLNESEALLGEDELYFKKNFILISEDARELLISFLTSFAQWIELCKKGYKSAGFTR